MRALTSAMLVAMLGLGGWIISPGSTDTSSGLSPSRGVVTLGTGCCKLVQ
jgi:hypothetical protein